MYDVITIGSATVDVFAHTESELITIKDAHGQEELIAYPSGSKILIEELNFSIGGGGTNTAVSFSRLGLKTAYLGELGDDDNGKKVLELLKKENIRFIGKRSNRQTGYSIILDSIGDDRTILTNKGANNFLSYPKKLPKSRWFYFSSMMGKSLKTLVKISDIAKKEGRKVAFNPSTYLIKDNPEDVRNILKNTDVLIFNKEEAELLCGIGNIKTLLKVCMTLGPDIVAITDGKKGCYATDGKKIYSILPRKVKVMETTGAGDSFASSFISGMIKGKDIEFSMRLGMVNSESVIQNLGAKEVLLSYRAALRSMKKGPHKVRKESLK